MLREEDHTYWLDGKLIPGVTTIIKDLTDYSIIPPIILETARQKGNAVHAMINLWATDNLGERADQPDWLQPCYDEMLRFIDDSGLKIIASEKLVYHPQYKYAGTLDIRCTMRGKNGIGIIDAKRSFFAGAAIGLQLAGYQGAENINIDQEPVLWRAALKINEKSAYRLEPYDDRNDWTTFLACLVRYNWVKAHQ